MINQSPNASAGAIAHQDDEIGLPTLLAALRPRWRTLVGATLLAGVLGAVYSCLITPQFTSTTTFLPPQQQQSGTAAALSALSPLAGLAGAAVKSPGDEYISLMQSVTVSDRMIEHFNLMAVYETKYHRDARRALASHVQIALGKKDGLISVSVDDADPRRAADMANQYIEELRRMTSVLAISEAQQRRVFFEKQMQDTKARLVAAQTALQQSGFTAGAIKAEPQAAAEQYARVRAEATAAEVRLQTLRESLVDTAPEVRQQAAQLAALRTQLDQLAATAQPDASGPDYISKYREFKYQETLFDLMAKQYALARVDESREGALVQVVDPALPAELKSKPKRSLIALSAALMGLIAASAWVLVGRYRKLVQASPAA